MNARTKMVLAAQKRHAAYGRMMATEAGSHERRSSVITFQAAKREHVEARRAFEGK